MAETWDESKPAGSRSPTLGDDDIREFKRAIRERLAEDHIFQSTESPAFGAGGGYDIGKHKFITLVQRNTSKVTASDEVAFVCKEVSGSPELILTPPSAGTDRQLTKNAGANFNLNSSDFGTAVIPSAGIIADAVNSSHLADDSVYAAHIAADQVNSSHIPDYAIGASQLNTSAVGTDQLNSSAVVPSVLGTWESAGNTQYFTLGNFGGGLVACPGGTTWLTRVLGLFLTPGTYRFYWGYAPEGTNNQYSQFQILKNSGVIVGPITYNGTGGSDPMVYRTDDLTLAAGDLIEFQARNKLAGYPGTMRINLRGANRTGIVIVQE